jgi:hypothetical protein
MRVTALTLTITNGIDLDGEGGMVWIKPRSYAGSSQHLQDTERGVGKRLASDLTSAEGTLSDGGFTAFNSDGFVVTGNAYDTNISFETFASWTFRKAPKFFDIVTYTGTSSTPRSVAHNLGSTPGFVIMKRTDTGADWHCWHRSQVNGFFYLNATNAATNTGVQYFTASDTEFTFNSGSAWNTSGGTYVMYLFAHDAGGFGDDGEQNVISCGSFIPTTSMNISLGWEPQFVLIKLSLGSTADWFIVDNMRGMIVGQDGLSLSANNSNADDSAAYVTPTANGFTAGSYFNGRSNTYIYIAIRRGPMKTPTAGTEVYNAIARTGTGSAATVTGVGFAPDSVWTQKRAGAVTLSNCLIDRLRGGVTNLSTTNANPEGAIGTSEFGTVQEGISVGGDNENNKSAFDYINWFFRRAPGFMDVCCYTGTGANRTLSHNLGVAPELIIVKNRGNTSEWVVGSSFGASTYQRNFLHLTNGYSPVSYSSSSDFSAAPTSTVFSVGTESRTNANTFNFVAYLFTSLAGVSKVGTYTGNGTSVSVTTGFQPRFILVKRTDSTGNWIVGDSARGLVAGNDPYLLLNSTAVEATNQDWVDISATGFTVNETGVSANASGGTYLYLAIS